ncbi:MAG: winged helix-turn-helix domain-containing protein [Acidobacteria bacterium]|nr:winged helix-turn-helix domain-containing protein [Acidobacteriota bacterium]
MLDETNGGKAEANGFVTGDWTVSPRRNLLVRGDEKVRVEPRVMDVLVYLSGRIGEVVSKEDLVEQVWQGRYVSDDVLTVTVYALRKALGDDARRPRYVETVSRRGYRWIAPVTGTGSTELETGLAWVQDAVHKLDAPASRRIAWGKIAAIAIALAIFVSGITLILAISSRSKHITSAEVHEAYLKGRFFLDQRSIVGCRQALEQFERAVALDPRDPAAQAGLADTYSAMSDFGVASAAEMRPRAMEAAERALALEPQSAEGHAALGRALFLFDWNFAAAERSLKRALELNPNYMPAHQTMAWLKSAQGHHEEAVAAAQRALQIDPVNTARYNELAYVFTLGGHFDRALGETERALRLNPRSVNTHFMKGWIDELAGRPDTAFAAYREALRIAGAPETTLRRIEAVYRAEGLEGFYRDWVKTGVGLPVSDTWRAQLYVRAGQFDRAMESLEGAYRKREGALAWVNVEPSFAPLRSDVRFQQIAAHVGQR